MDPVRSAGIEFFVNLAKLEGDMGKAAAIADKTGDKIARSFKKVRDAMIGIGEVIAIGEIVRATAEGERAFAQLEAAVKSTGGAAGFTAEQLDEMANSFEKVTTFSNDAIGASEAILLSFNRIGKEVFPQAEKAALNLATRMGIDLNSAVKTVGKALQDPQKGLTALGKAGVMFTESQKAMIKSMTESGNLLGAQKIILAELEVRMGGAAEAARNNLGGALIGVKNAADHLLESLGHEGAGGLTGVLNTVAKGFDFLSEHAKEVDAALAGIAAGAGFLALLELPAVINKAASAIKVALTTMGTEAAIATGGLTLAVGLAAAAFVEFKDTQIQVGEDTVTAWTVMQASWEAAQKSMESFVQACKPAIDSFFKFMGEQLKQAMKLWQGFMNVLSGVFDYIGRVARVLANNPIAGPLVKPLVQGFDQAAAAAKKWQDDTSKAIGGVMKRAAELNAQQKKGKGGGGPLNPFDGEIEAAAGKQKAYSAKEYGLLDFLDNLELQNKELELTTKYTGQALEFEKARAQIEAKLGHELLPFELQSLKYIFDQRAKIKQMTEAQVAAEKASELYKSTIAGLNEEVQKRADILSYGKEEAAIRERIRALHEKGLTLTKEQEKVYRDLLQHVKDEDAIIASNDFVRGLEDKLDNMKQQAKEQELINQGKKLEAAVSRDIYELQKKIGREVDETTKDQIRAQEALIRQQQLMDEGAKMMRDMMSESEKYAESVAHLSELLQAGAISWDAYARKVADLNPKMKQFRDLGHDVGRTLVSAMDQWIEKGGKFSDVLKGIGKDLLKIAEQKLLIPMISNIFDNIANKLFQPKRPPTPTMNAPGGWTPLQNPGIPGSYIPGYAMGGFPEVGKPAIVGERGPELFIPTQQGMIVPNQPSYADQARAMAAIAQARAEQNRSMGLTMQASGFDSVSKMWNHYSGLNGGNYAFGVTPGIAQLPGSWLQMIQQSGVNPASLPGGFMQWVMQASGGVPITQYSFRSGGSGMVGSGYDDSNIAFNRFGGTGTLAALNGSTHQYNGGINMGPQTQGPSANPIDWLKYPEASPLPKFPKETMKGGWLEDEQIDELNAQNRARKRGILGIDYWDGPAELGTMAAFHQHAIEMFRKFFPRYEGFARGGRPPVRKPSIVGEQGPELFVPDSAGTVVPNGKFGVGGGTRVEVHNYSGAPAREERTRSGKDEIVRIIIGDFKTNGPIAQDMRRRFGIQAQGAGRS